MSKYSQIALDTFGLVADTNAFDVGNEWNKALNIRFNNSASEKIGGEVLALYTDQEPYHLQFNGRHDAPLWFYMGDTYIASTDLSTETDISAGATITSGVNWDSTLFNLIPVFNNEIDPPWTWSGTGDVSPLPAFPTSTICKSIRPFRSFLVALNITESGTQDGNRLIWSDSSDAGALPASWDISDPTTLAGDAYLTSTKGEIIDGLQMRDLFVIYKTHSCYIMRLTNLQSVMKIERVQLNSGILAKNCVQEFKGKHFIVSDGDVVLFDGQSVASIADKRVRAEIFGNIDAENFRNTFVARYDRQDEMWVCFPTVGNTNCNKVAIWNWKDDTWTFRNLTGSRHMASGLADITPLVKWVDATYVWTSAESLVPWSPISSNPTIDSLLNATVSDLGGEMSPDESFDDPSAWSLGSENISNGQCILGSIESTTTTSLEPFNIGIDYSVTIDIESTTGGVTISTGDIDQAPVTASGTYVYTYTGTDDISALGVKCFPGNSAVINSCSFKRVEANALSVLDEGFDSFGEAMPSELEKRTMDLGTDQVKIVKNVIPRITANSGTKIYIRIGTQDHPDDTVDWHPEVLYTVGQDRETCHLAQGRYISIRFRTQDTGVNWKLHGYRIEVAETGRY